MKTCSVCGLVFPLSEFYIRRDRNKPIARCRKCNAAASRRSKANRTLEQIKQEHRKRGAYYEAQARAGNLKAIIQHKLASWKGNARNKGVPFALTTDYLLDLFKQQEGCCYYTGQPLSITSGMGRGKTTLPKRPKQFSLDRLNPALGYVPGNVVWCCWLVNTMKNYLGEDAFYKLCWTVVAHATQRGLQAA